MVSSGIAVASQREKHKRQKHKRIVTNTGILSDRRKSISRHVVYRTFAAVADSTAAFAAAAAV